MAPKKRTRSTGPTSIPRARDSPDWTAFNLYCHVLMAAAADEELYGERRTLRALGPCPPQWFYCVYSAPDGQAELLTRVMLWDSTQSTGALGPGHQHEPFTWSCGLYRSWRQYHHWRLVVHDATPALHALQVASGTRQAVTGSCPQRREGPLGSRFADLGSRPRRP
jgi:hypothetical protein